MLKKIIASCLLLFSVTCVAALQKPLPADQAFQFSGFVKNEKTIVLQWDIAPDYYLYKDRFSYKITTPETISFQAFKLPAGIAKQDELLGNYEVFQKQLTIEVPLKNPQKSQLLDVKVCYQGCSENGFCYPPATKRLHFDLQDTTQAKVLPQKVLPIKPKKIASHDKISNLLTNSSIWLIVLSFLGFGLLLSFTPCVLPMIPILSGIIMGHKKTLTTGRAFLLSSTYVLGMAITYAVIGIMVGYAGQSIQAALQTPLVITLFSGVFVLLALSLFGMYEIKLPSRFETKVSDLSNNQRSGTYFGVLIMGILATLIVSPCVTAPLVGALAYIAKTGNAALGGLALFMLGIGMGIPLILIGTSHGKLLPRAGKWMDSVKAFLGVLLLATAIWMLARIIPAPVAMLLWAILLIIFAVYLGLLSPDNHKGWGNFWRGLGLVLAIYGVILMIGAALGNGNPLQPLQAAAPPYNVSKTALLQSDMKTITFTPVKNNSDFDKALSQGIQDKQITLLDFYADWCIACKEMDHKVFNDSEVAKKAQAMNTLRANVTANDIFDKAIQERFGVIAPPTILFFDKNGNELADFRIVGEMNKKEFIAHLNELAEHTASTP